MSAPGSPLHLVRRFLGTLRARPLGPAAQTLADSLLSAGERPLFWEQSAADQRHAVDAARSVMAVVPGRVNLARAALPHDVGKRHAGVGILARSGASIAAMLHLPTSGRWADYLDHGSLGAHDLEAAGAEPLVVAFARRHHIGRPDTIGADDWRVLQSADRA